MNPKLANPGNVIRCKVGGGLIGSDLAHENEAPFPESLVEPFIRCFCPPGGIVYDAFCGSGTTHCLAGAAQALSADPEIRAMRPLDAGRKLLPSASYLFFAPQETVERYLRSRPWRVASA